jgi:predicted dehydrogenase|tara:strand:- start:1223 stop:2251 length:1029 start_codon:yes stop_codon:yes gene_type:complete
MIGIGVIGYGYWGPNLVRNFSEAAGSRVVAVSDLTRERLDRVSSRYPNVLTTTEASELIDNPAVDAVAIATPVSTHFDLGMRALEAGKHVWVEKPLAATSDEAQRLRDEAAARGLVLMVDHTFVYTGAVRKIADLVRTGQLGSLYYYDSVRVNLGLFQYDVDVMWDLAVHDLSIMDYVLDVRPRAVSAIGSAHVPGRTANLAYLTCLFDDSLIAHFHVNWLAPVKVRRTLIGGDRQMIVYDDLEPSEKVRVYDKGITVDPGPEGRYEMLVSYRTGDMWAPQLETTEALTVAARDFIGSIETGGTPVTNSAVGLRVVRILEAATRSMKNRGELIELDLAKVGA